MKLLIMTGRGRSFEQLCSTLEITPDEAIWLTDTFKIRGIRDRKIYVTCEYHLLKDWQEMLNAAKMQNCELIYLPCTDKCSPLK